MNWLARARLDYETVARRLRARDCYDWHQRAWEAFPGRPKGHPRPFLFRLRERDRECEFLLLCREEPTRPDWAADADWEVKTVGEGFLSYRRYRFDLLANPTSRDDARDRWDGRERLRGKHRRFNVATVEQQRDWIVRKAGQHGFRLLEDSEESPLLDIGPRRDFRFTRHDKSHGLHVGVCYRGGLEVTDSVAFCNAFKQGIGSAKSFGFGLLLLVPVA